MKFILVDTANARGSVAVFENDKPVRVESHSTDENYASCRPPAVHSVLAASCVTLCRLNVAAEVTGCGVRRCTADSEVLTALPEWPQFAGQGHVIEEVAAPFAVRLGSLAYRKFQTGDSTDALSLDANYVRRSDAEVLWKGNKSPLSC